MYLCLMLANIAGKKVLQIDQFGTFAISFVIGRSYMVSLLLCCRF